MAYYILYPSRTGGKKLVKLVTKKPEKPVKGYGFAEGPLRTLKDVEYRLNAMNKPNSQRPLKVRTKEHGY